VLMAPTRTRPPRFVAVDVETTGLDDDARIVEIAMVERHREGTISRWHTLLEADGVAGPTHIHGIRDEELNGVPSFADIAPMIAASLDGAVLVAHNSDFECERICYEFSRLGLPITIESVCTLEAARDRWPEQPANLGAVAARLGVDLEFPHMAVSDAMACLEVAEKLDLCDANLSGNRMDVAAVVVACQEHTPARSVGLSPRPELATDPLLQRGHPTAPTPMLNRGVLR
jgi:DNA polymerase III epsilon subunit family exonuclease